MWIRNVIGVALLVLVFQGCKDTELYTVQGNIQEFYLGAPLEGVEVEFAYGQISYGSVSSAYERIGTTLSNSEGNYAFGFEPRPASAYRIRAIKDGYILQEAIIQNAQWSTDRINELDIKMYASATMTFRLRNLDDEDEQVLFKLHDHSDGCKSCCFKNQSVFAGGIIDTSFTCSVYANQTLSYTATEITSLGTNEKSGEIFVQAGPNEFIYDF